MPAQPPHFGFDVPANLRAQLAVVEKCYMLGPRQPGHDPESVPGGFVEQADWRRGVETNRVDAGARHRREVRRHAIRIRVLPMVAVRGESAVRHPSYWEPLPIDIDEFSVGSVGEHFREGKLPPCHLHHGTSEHTKAVCSGSPVQVEEGSRNLKLKPVQLNRIFPRNLRRLPSSRFCTSSRRHYRCWGILSSSMPSSATQS